MSYLVRWCCCPTYSHVGAACFFCALFTDFRLAHPPDSHLSPYPSQSPPPFPCANRAFFFYVMPPFLWCCLVGFSGDELKHPPPLPCINHASFVCVPKRDMSLIGCLHHPAPNTPLWIVLPKTSCLSDWPALPLRESCIFCLFCRNF